MQTRRRAKEREKEREPDKTRYRQQRMTSSQKSPLAFSSDSDDDLSITSASTSKKNGNPPEEPLSVDKLVRSVQSDLTTPVDISDEILEEEEKERTTRSAIQSAYRHENLQSDPHLWHMLQESLNDTVKSTEDDSWIYEGEKNS